MKRYAKVKLYAEARYSGATYMETIFVKDIEKALTLDDTEIGVGELDGKHSEVIGCVEVEIVDETYFIENPAPKNDEGDHLLWHIEEHFGEDAIFEPDFRLTKKEIVCSEGQYEKIMAILNAKEEVAVVSESRLKHLEDRDWYAECLDGAGVDNWCGYEYAMEDYEAEE